MKNGFYSFTTLLNLDYRETSVSQIFIGLQDKTGVQWRSQNGSAQLAEQAR